LWLRTGYRQRFVRDIPEQIGIGVGNVDRRRDQGIRKEIDGLP